MTLEDEPPRSTGVQYATEEEQNNSSRKKEKTGPKWKWQAAVDVSSGESKVWFCKEQYCIGAWKIRFMNQGKWDIVKKVMAK